MNFTLEETEIDVDSDALPKELIPDDEELAEIPNETPVVTPVITHEVTVCDGGDDTEKADKDYDKVRKNLDEMIEHSLDSLASLKALADNSDNPYAFDAMSKLIRSITEANKTLLELHKDKKELKDESETAEAPGIVQNNFIYNGTLKDLLELKKQNEKKEKV